MDWKKYKSQIFIVIAIIGLIIYGAIVKSDKINSFSESKPINTPETETSTADTWMCHITGEVNNPGVYEFKEGSRLQDIVKLAGGFTKDAYQDELNLSMRISDEMKITIRNKQKMESAEPSNSEMTSVYSTESNKVNLNTADKSQLMELQGIGEKKADQIIEIRQQTPFQKIEDIMNVPGIGQKTFEGLKDAITVK